MTILMASAAPWSYWDTLKRATLGTGNSFRKIAANQATRSAPAATGAAPGTWRCRRRSRSGPARGPPSEGRPCTTVSQHARQVLGELRLHQAQGAAGQFLPVFALPERLGDIGQFRACAALGDALSCRTSRRLRLCSLLSMSVRSQPRNWPACRSYQVGGVGLGLAAPPCPGEQQRRVQPHHAAPRRLVAAAWERSSRVGGVVSMPHRGQGGERCAGARVPQSPRHARDGVQPSWGCRERVRARPAVHPAAASHLGETRLRRAARLMGEPAYRGDFPA